MSSEVGYISAAGKFAPSILLFLKCFVHCQVKDEVLKNFSAVILYKVHAKMKPYTDAGLIIK